MPPETATTGFISRNFDAPELPRGADKTESALGILRVTRKRLEKFFAEKKEVQTLLHEENVLLDRLYFKLHMGRIKEELAGVMNFEPVYAELREKLKNVFGIEKKIAEELKK